MPIDINSLITGMDLCIKEIYKFFDYSYALKFDKYGIKKYKAIIWVNSVE